MKDLILGKDYAGIRNALIKHPERLHEGLTPDGINNKKGHPLHRLCDFVFSGQLTEDQAVTIASIYLESGASVNGYDMILKKDTPLIAASSLHADKLAILYIEQDANIHHQGTHGGTALHWAAWCGRDTIVKRLIDKGADINQTCIDFQATPLFWAVKSYKEKNDPWHQLTCAKLLVEAGADKTIPNGTGITIYSMMDENDTELKNLIKVEH
jgi:hypothetical protein